MKIIWALLSNFGCRLLIEYIIIYEDNVLNQDNNQPLHEWMVCVVFNHVILKFNMDFIGWFEN